jgi:hypothetical protein
VIETIKYKQWLSIKVEKVLYDVINFAVIDAGFDFEGKPIKTYAFSNAGQIKGFRGKVFVAHEISENMKKSTSYDSTHSFGTEDIDGNTDNGIFRNKVRAAAKDLGNKIVGTFGQPRFKVSLHVRGSINYAKGQLYVIEYPGIFRDKNDVLTGSLKLRLRQITHTYTSKGWFTDLEFIQDELTLYGSVPQ